MYIELKRHIKLFALALAILTAATGLLYGCSETAGATPVADWFTQELRSYGWNTITYDFYYYEDHSAYMMTANIAYDETAGAFFLDEIVDVTPGYEQYVPYVEMFADQLIYWLNIGTCDLEDFFPEGLPQDFQPHTTYLHDIVQFCRAGRVATDTVYLPLVTN